MAGTSSGRGGPSMLSPNQIDVERQCSKENQLKHYETLMLLKTEATGDEIKFLEDSINKRVTEFGGSIVAFDKWGKLRLAYPIKKQDYGIYILSRYSIPKIKASAFVKDLETFFVIKCNEFVIRNVSVLLEDEHSEDYKRPDSVDSANGGRGGGRGRGPGRRDGGFKDGGMDSDTDDFLAEKRDVVGAARPVTESVSVDDLSSKKGSEIPAVVSDEKPVEDVEASEVSDVVAKEAE